MIRITLGGSASEREEKIISQQIESEAIGIFNRLEKIKILAMN